MKKLNFILLLLLTTAIAKAQDKPFNFNASVDKSGRLIRYTASVVDAGLNLGIGIDKNTQWIEYHNMVANQPYNNYVFLKGTKTITLFGYVPKDSINYYRYNIIENDSKLLATDATLAVKSKSPRPMAKNLIEINFGAFNVDSKKLTIETYKITERSQVKVTTIYNKEIKSAQIVTVARSGTGKKSDFVMMEDLKDGAKFKIHDTETLTGLDFVIKPTDLPFLFNVYLKNISTGQSTFVSNNWQYDYFMGDGRGAALPYVAVNASFFNTPGDYELQIIPKLPGGFNIKSFPEKTTTFHFTILPSGIVYQQSAVIRFVLIMLLAILCIVSLIFYIIKMRNKKRLAVEKQQKDIAQLQLDAVRSQLNPHFLFNALSGIQNLINKTEIDQANRYLARFARLTRNILNNRELVDLGQERALIDDYLQMEQLRFGFDYEITTNPELENLAIQIPSMLIQPFAENAVKHGIADKQGTARISVSIKKNKKDIEISIADNGHGFDIDKQHDGLGIQLSRKRIALLNTVYKDSPIRLDLQSDERGTIVTITLTHWL